MSEQFTEGPWDVTEHGISSGEGYCDVASVQDGAVYDEYDSDPATLEFSNEANARLIAAAPDYAVACGLHLHPGDNETCGPLSWLRTAIDTLKEDAVRHAACGDDTDAYWHMVNELEGLLAGLVNASAKARGETSE